MSVPIIERIEALTASIRRALRPGDARRMAAAFAQRRAGRGAWGAIIGRFGPSALRMSPPRLAGSGGRSAGTLRVEVARARPVLFPQRAHGTVHLSAAGLRRATRSASSILEIRAHERVILGALPDDLDTARAIAALAAAGTPLEFVGADRAHQRLLGPGTIDAITRPPSTDHRSREARSVRIRRCAMLEHGDLESVPDVSVILSSQRPADLIAAVDQVAAQREITAELVVGLHGPQWSQDWSSRLAEHWRGPLQIIRAEAGVPFGSLLTSLGRASQGALITKWDDDDWYGPHHLVDLALAYQYSGAELVGKAAEFVYLAGSDRTVRRFAVGAETYSPTLAGGTMTASREWLSELGWWPPIARNVDQHTVKSTLDARGRVYRLHGFEYVLRRSDSERHTWSVPDTHFLDRATDSRPGLDIAFAGIDGS